MSSKTAWRITFNPGSYTEIVTDSCKSVYSNTSECIKALISMQHEGSFHLDDIRHLQDDEALRTVLALNKLPRATTLGDWLRRMGNQPHTQEAWVKVNKALLQSALHRCKKVTLDIKQPVKAKRAWTWRHTRAQT